MTSTIGLSLQGLDVDFDVVSLLEVELAAEVSGERHPATFDYPNWCLYHTPGYVSVGYNRDTVLFGDMVTEEEQYRYHPYYVDRPDAMLTQRERRYLAGESDIEPKSQEERGIRQAIRDRVRESILDFRILREQLEERDREKIFSKTVGVGTNPEEFYERTSSSPAEIPPGEVGEIDPGWVTGSATDMIAFLYLQIDNPRTFSSKVEEAISRAARSAGYDARVDVDIDLEIGESIDEIHERLEQEGVEGVNARELRLLRDAGKIERMEYHELALEREQNLMEGSSRRLRRASKEEAREASKPADQDSDADTE